MMIMDYFKQNKAKKLRQQLEAQVGSLSCSTVDSTLCGAGYIESKTDVEAFLITTSTLSTIYTVCQPFSDLRLINVCPIRKAA